MKFPITGNKTSKILYNGLLIIKISILWSVKDLNNTKVKINDIFKTWLWFSH